MAFWNGNEHLKGRNGTTGSASICIILCVLLIIQIVTSPISIAQPNVASETGQSTETDYQSAPVYILAAAVRKGDSKALFALRTRGEKGVLEAQIALGRHYWRPQDGIKNPFESFKWWHMAAEQGNAEAALTIGGMYQAGLGVKRDYLVAEKWLRRAAEKGDVRAQNELARLYEKGKGVKQDYREAYFWYLVAKPPFGVCFDCQQPFVSYEKNAGSHLGFFTRLSIRIRAMAWKPIPPQSSPSPKP